MPTSSLTPPPPQAHSSAHSPNGAGGHSSHPHPWRSKNPLTSFRHAIEGVVHTFRTQRNMRIHFFTLILVLATGLLYRLPPVEMIVLLFAVALVLIAEMFNTAIETVVDMITTSYNPAAKFAKDIAAGAVFIAAVNAAVVGLIVFFGSGRPQEVALRLRQPPLFFVFVASALLLLVLVLVWKMVGGKGTLTQGGVVSFHSAIAFFLACTVVFFSSNVFAAFLAVVLAALVAQSRVEARIHTLQEVVIGALLALFLSAGVYGLSSFVPVGSRFVPALPGGISTGSRPSGPARPVAAPQPNRFRAGGNFVGTPQ